LDFLRAENGEILLATGGQDSYIAVWRLTKETLTSDFEFQIHQFQDYSVIFDSMIIGHEGWISSLQWNSKGNLTLVGSFHYFNNFICHLTNFFVYIFNFQDSSSPAAVTSLLSYGKMLEKCGSKNPDSVLLGDFY